MAKIVKGKVETLEELKKRLLASNIKDIRHSIEMGILPLNPTRYFNVNERVHFGAHEEVYVREIGEDGLYYICEAIGVKRDPRSEGCNEYHVTSWHELYPYGKSQDTKFAREEKYRIRQYNSSIDSLLNMVYGGHAGVDFDAEYQREHVWTMEDKVDLIESIFNNIEIGKFIFVQLHESTPGKYYQIVDGKQRLTALCEFYEDRFSYKGVYFSQLSLHDKYTFTTHSVSYGFLENPDTRGIYETFIKMNTCGKPMDKKHIDKVKKLLEDLE
jgi:hypothetical protein